MQSQSANEYMQIKVYIIDKHISFFPSNMRNNFETLHSSSYDDKYIFEYVLYMSLS
jgi:hypothetical protein